MATSKKYTLESRLKRPYMLPCNKVLGTFLDEERKSKRYQPLCKHPHKLQLTEEEYKQCIAVETFKYFVDKHQIIVS